MKERFFDKFRLLHEQEDVAVIRDNIEKGVLFRGTNLWILIFAIFIASLGLNVNSTAVIIGAMLISPLMGPIMGIGLSVAIHHVTLFRKSLINYLIATGVALATSTLFFLISPIGDAHSEMMARTSPNIYDVLIAFFGGLAGILANSSKQKGNVIPGVAIATALMPPLCTAGYGLATWKANFFFGAFYLFWINTVFIALATFITSRFLRFPFVVLPDDGDQKKANRIMWAIVIVTLGPSIYFGWDVVRKDRFTREANRFIDTEAHFPNDYLLNRKINANEKHIILTYGGQQISDEEIIRLKDKLKFFALSGVQLEVHQGFAYLASATNGKEDEQLVQLRSMIQQRDLQLKTSQDQLDSIRQERGLSRQIYRELKTKYTDLREAVITPVLILSDSSGEKRGYIINLTVKNDLALSEKKQLEAWLKVRLNNADLRLTVQRIR